MIDAFTDNAGSFYQNRTLAPLWLDRGVANARATTCLERARPTSPLELRQDRDKQTKPRMIPSWPSFAPCNGTDATYHAAISRRVFWSGRCLQTDGVYRFKPVGAAAAGLSIHCDHARGQSALKSQDNSEPKADGEDSHDPEGGCPPRQPRQRTERVRLLFVPLAATPRLLQLEPSYQFR